MEQEILELKFEGNQINPSAVYPHEIAELIQNFESVLTSTIKQQNPTFSTEQLLFSFYEIDNKSLDIRFRVQFYKDIVVASYFLISTSLTQGNFKDLNKDAIEGLKEITKFSKKYNCEGSFNYNDQNLSKFTPKTEIKFEKENEIKGETSIYGVVLRVGGESPTIHFKVNNDYRIVFNTKYDIAKKLASKLYEEIGLTGIARWDYKSYKVIDFSVTDIIEYEQRPVKQTFDELNNLIGKYWDDIDNTQTTLDE